MQPRPDRLRRLALAGGAVLLLTGCGAAAKQGVAMDEFSSDIVFGAPTPAPAVAAAPATVLTPNNAVSLVVPEPAPPSFPGPTAAPVLSSLGVCPEAGLTAFPAAPAGSDVDSLPAAGAYRWKQVGTITVGGRAEALDGFQTRLLRRVTQVSDNLDPISGQPNLAFTFQTVEPFDATGNSIVLSWKVMTNAPAATVDNPLGPFAPSAPQSASASNPEGGLALEGIDYVDSSGRPVAGFTPFHPSVGLLYLPLPVSDGQQWTASATDPSSQTQVQISGTVDGRARIDACGDVVDGWSVAATLTTTVVGASGTQTQTQHDSYEVAPQLGGFIISEAIEGGSSWGPVDATFSLGQLHPGPLPAGQQ